MWTVHAPLPGLQDVVALTSDHAGGAVVLATSRAVTESGTVVDESAALVLSRYDERGLPLWSQTLGISPAASGKAFIHTSSLAASPTGEVFVALRVWGGGTLHLGASPPTGDRFLAKLSADGTPRWVLTEEAEVLAADGEGGVVAVTRTGRVSRYDAQGLARWTWTSTEAPVFFTTVAVDAAGGVVAAGHKAVGLTHDQGVILALSPTGEERWRTTTPEQPGWSTFTDLALLPEGGVLLTGTFNRSFLWGNYRVNPSCAGAPCTLAPYLLAMDAGGQPLWAQALEGYSLNPRVAVGPDGDAVVAWEAACNSRLMRVSPEGQERWRSQELSSPCMASAIFPRDIDFLRDGTLMRAGMFSGQRSFLGTGLFTADQGDVYLQRLLP